ncbi:MAG: bifunctional 4-hydroxy-2-oxoglutarate aldolase/2-dehydro-3-deoxy-phosphogluconate aldolase [Lachnospiraceae bacterium]|nr:bifunctional 4-hydroxy-2-oxoglutarate aldolase/2-dehydro-3-deoxy-phosphogluconate aldolase [Lachnospiraceae bacterium]
MDRILERMGELGVVPVVVLERKEDAVPLAGAMKAGGIPCAEITLRTSAGLAAIEALAEQEDEDFLVGAGSVLTRENCRDAVAAGAKFIVSPGFNRRVVEYCIEREITVLPGCVTPTEITEALEMGLDTVKFFPAGTYGGLSAMKALAGPFPGIHFVPTGGVSEKNLAEYLKAPFVRAVGGSWLCTRGDIAAGRFAHITSLCRQAGEIKRKAEQV